MNFLNAGFVRQPDWKRAEIGDVDKTDKGDNRNEEDDIDAADEENNDKSYE